MMRRRSFTTLALSLFTLSSPLGCAWGDRDLYGADDFGLVVKRFNWETGGSTGVVIDNTTMTRVWVTSERHEGEDGVWIEPVFWKASTELSTDELERVRQACADARFLRLRERYVDRSVHDGQDDWYVLRLGSRTHRVHLQNKTPGRIEKIDRVLRATDGPDEADGVRLSHEELEAFWEAALAD